MDILWAIFFFLLGLEIGSFLNVVIDRLPTGGSLLHPPSHCDSCNTRLRTADLIPLVSFLWLGGRCRYCGVNLSWRIFLVEMAAGLMLTLLWVGYGWSHDFWILAVYGLLLIAVIVIDLDHQLILNKMTYPAAVFALATVHWRDDLNYIDSTSGNVLLGGALGFVILFMVVVVSRGGMGMGDVKLSTVMGLALGFPIFFVGLLVGIFSGGFAAVILLAMKRKGRKQAIPFGPFLALGFMVALIRGEGIWDWYRDLIPG